jgi:ABC-type glycerol-3-phosphate transport system substrate-binding protein
VSAAGRRLPLERRLAFDVLLLNPTLPNVPPAVANAFAVWPPVFANQLTTLTREATPDLVLTDSRWVAALGKADVLVDLAPLLRGERWFQADAYAGDALATGRVRGRQLGIPLGVWAEALLYDAGRGRWGLFLDRDPSPSLWTLAWQLGASLVAPTGLAVTLGEPATLRALQLLDDFVRKLGVARPPEGDPPSALEVMAQRDAAMLGLHAGQTVFWRLKLATWPTGDRPGGGGGVFGYAPMMVGIPRNAPRRDLSMEALGALVENVAEGVMMPAGRRTPGAAPGAAEQLTPEDAAVLERIRAAARFLPGDFPYFAVQQLLVDELFVPMLSGRKKPEQAAADAQSAIDRRLADFARAS